MVCDVMGWKAGYKHVDCSPMYGNEVQVGEALGEAFNSGLCPRADVFVTSKLPSTAHDPADAWVALLRSLRWSLGTAKSLVFNVLGVLGRESLCFQTEYLAVVASAPCGLVYQIVQSFAKGTNESYVGIQKLSKFRTPVLIEI